MHFILLLIILFGGDVRYLATEYSSLDACNLQRLVMIEGLENEGAIVVKAECLVIGPKI